MSLTIGRMGLDVEQTNVAGLVGGGNDLTISGRVSSAGGFNASVLREQMVNLKENPHEGFYPVLFDEHPWINGYYQVTDASVDLSSAGALTIGWYPFTVTLRRLSTSAAPLIESRTLGITRGNFQSVDACQSWLAIPDQATGFRAVTADPTSIAVETRHVEEGLVRVYRGPVADPAGDPGIIDAFCTYLVPPENWYDGSARIRTGLLERISPTEFDYTGGPQEYVVPDGITKLQIDASGAQGAGRLGSRGGRVVCDLDVTPGETLQINVGGVGRSSSGGWPDGGDGGSALAKHRGWGGGGSTDVRQGGTALGNRAVIAGAGGGMGGANPVPVGRTYAGWRGGRGGVRAGTDGETTRGGRRGTATAGGAPGTPYTGRPSGTAGSSGAGGDGASTAATNFYGGGGGGGGRFGGGGGSADVMFGAGGSGGGGSGLSTGHNSISQVGVRKGNGKVILTPILSQPDVARYTVVGDQCPNSPLGWELSNGMVRMTPVYLIGHIEYDVSVWTGSAWGDPVRWQLGVVGDGTIDADVSATAMVVLVNTPEECIIQVTYEYTNRQDIATVTLSLRRGSTMVLVRVHGPEQSWAFRTVASSSGTRTLADGEYLRLTQTTADSDGNKWVVTSPYPVTYHTPALCGPTLIADNTDFVVGVGFVPSWIGISEDNLWRQWMANMTVSSRAVIR